MNKTVKFVLVLYCTAGLPILTNAVPVTFDFLNGGNAELPPGASASPFVSNPIVVPGPVGGTLTLTATGSDDIHGVPDLGLGIGFNRMENGESVNFTFAYTPGSPGATLTVTTITFPDVTDVSNGVSRFEAGDTADFGGTSFAGGVTSLDVSGLGLSSILISPTTGNGLRISSVTVDVAAAPPPVGAVPEPSSVLFMATALAGICYVRRRRSA